MRGYSNYYGIDPMQRKMLEAESRQPSLAELANLDAEKAEALKPTPWEEMSPQEREIRMSGNREGIALDSDKPLESQAQQPSLAKVASEPVTASKEGSSWDNLFNGDISTGQAVGSQAASQAGMSLTSMAMMTKNPWIIATAAALDIIGKNRKEEDARRQAKATALNQRNANVASALGSMTNIGRIA